MKENIVTVNSRKFDNRIYRTWQGELIEFSDQFINILGEFEKDVEHPYLGVIRRGTVSYEFFWFAEHYNVFRFHDSDGAFRNFYCNINLPPKFAHNILDYVDLDIDVLVWRDFSYDIVDFEDFEKNAETFSYTDELRQAVKEALSTLINKIENRIFPFDYKF